MDRGIDLISLADFRLVAAYGGFGKAARESDRSKATLSRRVRDLEDSLGRRLIERNGQTITLTEEGRTLLAATQAPLDDLDAAADAMRRGGAEPYGLLRVSAPLLIGHLSMGFAAARFRASHPRVTLEVTCEDRYVDLLQEGYHVAIRVNPRADDDLVGRPFLQEQLLVVAPTGLAQPGSAATGDPPPVPAVVRSSGWDQGLWRVRSSEEAAWEVRPDVVLKLSTVMMVRDAVLAGAGAALLPRFLIEEHLSSGRLRLWGVAEGRRMEVWIVHASNRLVSAKVSAFTTFIRETFREGSFARGLERLANDER